ncbi:FAD-NAD(P)-binding protein [Frigidibacter albus]|uniref:FAD-NAD(P)-binding protein n=1 Tax=Frigidibacter albus TaxID=1465486 RepID=A0A6L8VCB2_9RHOB|nr:FAD-NAD(P)-binding protein [Frigidibacter albus]MZQ87903.1 FAD-NAD(P)-binding protein [Frigidibacter albus]NBE29809.1 FAD-NAD(P)-binding protein [Frigidibacter albus]GGH42634.1 FAD/NAD(P) binding domain-containing protein [Frigidibacter albus]
MTQRIAIVGTGPTGIYTLQQLLQSPAPLSVTLFEKADKAGIGMPYSPETVSKSMLANIASIEIPPVTTSYLDWLEDQPTGKLASYGLDAEDLHDRQFTPRLLLGEYFRDQLLTLTTSAGQAGHQIDICERTEVLDILPTEDRLLLHTSQGEAGPFDRVILATGHEFPDEDEASRTYFPSPWSGLIEAEIPATSVGIMGTSLSAIDAAMAVAGQHGRFRRKDGELSFHPSGTGLQITLMSRSGVLPEADFYCPLPYEPLAVMTEAAVAACAKQPEPLDALFDLVRAEIMQADPAYAMRIGLGGLDADSFADAYFAAREAADPFRWARSNLEEVERNKADKVTVPWRYALLRMHERVEEIVADLPEHDRERLDKGLKKVFVDNYAAVPSESIRRLLALRDAGILSVLALGEDYDLTREQSRTVIETARDTHVFHVFIDARGQKPLSSKDMPFPTLRSALLDAGEEIPEVAEDYSLIGARGFAGRVFLGSIPYLMHDRPFVQGITACADIAEAIASGVATRRRRRLVS